MNIDLSSLKIKNELLDDLRSEKITMAEFDNKCAYWLLTFLNEFRFSPYPSQPPEIMDYVRKKKDDPEYKLTSEFWQQPHIHFYLSSHKTVRGLNLSNYYWLNFILKNLNKDDVSNKVRIENILKDYEGNYLDLRYTAPATPIRKW